MSIFGRPRPMPVQGGGAIELIGIDSGAATSSTNVNLTNPPGVQDGDLLIIFASTSNNNGFNVPLGWTQKYLRTGLPTCGVYQKIASSEGAGYTVSTTSTGNKRASLMVFRPSSGLGNNTDGATATGGADITTPSINADGGGLLLSLFYAFGGALDAHPAGMDVVLEEFAANPAHYVYSQPIGAGATGSRVLEITGTGGTCLGILAEILP